MILNVLAITCVPISDEFWVDFQRANRTMFLYAACDLRTAWLLISWHQISTFCECLSNTRPFAVPFFERLSHVPRLKAKCSPLPAPALLDIRASDAVRMRMVRHRCIYACASASDQSTSRHKCMVWLLYLPRWLLFDLLLQQRVGI